MVVTPSDFGFSFSSTHSFKKLALPELTLLGYISLWTWTTMISDLRLSLCLKKIFGKLFMLVVTVAFKIFSEKKRGNWKGG